MYCSSACKQRAYRARTAPGDGPVADYLARQATSAACALVAEATFLEVVLLTRQDAHAGISAHELAKVILGHARDLLTATTLMDPPPPRDPSDKTVTTAGPESVPAVSCGTANAEAPVGRREEAQDHESRP
jgi:hypothetical protein